MDAAKEHTRTYLQRVLRWWAGKGPAAKPQTQPALQTTQLTIIGSALSGTYPHSGIRAIET
ncbi:hypothetical protein XvhCFBP2543_07415 [Xanthomonas vasicola]|nr:hypothetical protein XvhCFBP2543_07415 [Xanthomonas vasicola]